MAALADYRCFAKFGIRAAGSYNIHSILKRERHGATATQISPMPSSAANIAHRYFAGRRIAPQTGQPYPKSVSRTLYPTILPRLPKVDAAWVSSLARTTLVLSFTHRKTLFLGMCFLGIRACLSACYTCRSSPIYVVGTLFQPTLHPFVSPIFRWT